MVERMPKLSGAGLAGSRTLASASACGPHTGRSQSDESVGRVWGWKKGGRGGGEGGTSQLTLIVTVMQFVSVKRI